MTKNIIGIFAEEDLLVASLKKIREEEIDITEVYTPYPVHEVFKILKRKTRLNIATLLFAALGFVSTYGFMYWSSVVDYPLVIGGKPSHSWPSYIVISFVMTIFFANLFSVITFLVRTGLYPGKKTQVIDPRITDNAFVVLINPAPEMSEKEIKHINSLLTKHGAIEVIEE
jgi:ActD protein